MYGDEHNHSSEAEGEGEVRSGRHYCKDLDIEILNPELYLATLEPDGRLFMEMTVERAWVCPAERNKKAEQIIGDIPWTQFSPIYKVNYTVENTVLASRLTMTA